TIHDIHHREREGGHDFVLHHGFRIRLEQGDIEPVVGMFFVEQGDDRAQIELPAHRKSAAADAVEGIAVADQDAQSSLGRGGGDANGNPADNAFAAVGAHYRLDHDFVTGPSFGHVGTGAFQTGGAAVIDQVETQVHAADIGDLIGIIENPAEVVAEG